MLRSTHCSDTALGHSQNGREGLDKGLTAAGMWNDTSVGCASVGCGGQHLWDVGCYICGIWDVTSVGCGVLHLWDVGCSICGMCICGM